MALNQNQFTKQGVVGSMDLSMGGISHALTLRIDPGSTAEDVVPGTLVKLVDGGADDPNGVPLVDVLGGDDEEATGVILYTPKQGKFQPGDIVQVAVEGDVVRMNAGAALARAVPVAGVNATAGNIQALGSNAQLGITLDKATAGDQLIRVKIKTAVAST